MFDDMYCFNSDEKMKLEHMLKRINYGLAEHRLVTTQVPEIAFQIVSGAHYEFYPECLEYDYHQNEKPSPENRAPKGLLKVSRWIQFPPATAIYKGC